MELRVVPGPLPVACRGAVRDLAGRATAADGIAPLDEAALLALADDAPVTASTLHVLAFEAAVPWDDADSSDTAQELGGYAQVDLGGDVPTAQLVVDPVARRRGLGRALLDAAGAAARRAVAGGTVAGGPTSEVRASAGDAADGGFEVWAHGDLPAARALAAAAGLQKAHELWRMSLDLRRRPAVEATWPPALVVRPFVPGQDEDTWLAVNARAFAGHPEQGRWATHDLAAREREQWFDPAGFLLAERPDGTLAGFVWTKVHATGELADEPVGEIYVVGVDPAAQGGGLGRALTAAGLAHLVGRGLATAVLWVAGDNAAAIRTYLRAGFRRVGLDARYARRPVDIAGSPDGATMGA